MTKTAFITGITGQDGSYLAEFMLKKNYKVVGLVSSRYSIGSQNIDKIKDKLILEDGDLLDSDSLEKIILKHRPDEIYNLAGLTFVPASWDRPTLTLNINTLGVTRILEIIKSDLPKSKFFQATSSKIFESSIESPQTEKTPLSPKDPYSISKASAHLLIQSYREKYNLFATSGILYNHESERRGEEFVTRKITQTAVKIKLGKDTRLPLGNLQSHQDWGYAPDYVEAMWLMLQQDKPQDFILASGKTHTVKDICEIAFTHLNLNWKDHVTKDTQFYREQVNKVIPGSPAKAKRVLNWEPKTNFKDMIIKMVENDLRLIEKEK